MSARVNHPGKVSRVLRFLIVLAIVSGGAATTAAALIQDDSIVATALPVETEEPLEVQLSAAFYADTSCLLTIDRRARVGRTLIDAKLANGDSRTLIHCDTEDGRRLTVLARGVTLGRYERTPLLSRVAIDDGTRGVIAWLTDAGTSFPDESAPRRYVTQGDVFVTETPQVQAAGTSLNVDRRAFAHVGGVLETPMSHPGGTDAGTSADRP